MFTGHWTRKDSRFYKNKSFSPYVVKKLHIKQGLQYCQITRKLISLYTSTVGQRSDDHWVLSNTVNSGIRRRSPQRLHTRSGTSSCTSRTAARVYEIQTGTYIPACYMKHLARMDENAPTNSTRRKNEMLRPVFVLAVFYLQVLLLHSERRRNNV